MRRLKDADHLDFHSGVTYPVGPDASGEVTYLHVPPLGAFTIITIALACIAVAAFIWCYLYPLIAKRQDRARAAKGHFVKQPFLASARSLFGWRSRAMTMTPPPPPPPTPQMLARYARLDMRITRPPPAVRHARGSWLAPLLSSSSSPPSSSSSSCSSSSSSSSSSPPPSSPISTDTLPTYAPPFGVPEVIVTPVDVGVLIQTTAGIRTTPKKSGDNYDGGKAEAE